MAADGSIIIEANIDAGKADKDLAKLKAKIEKTEEEIADSQKKRDAARDKSTILGADIESEHKKLELLKSDLREIKQISKDKMVSPSMRDEAKANLPDVQERIREQQEYVRRLESEWKKLENSADRYEQKISDAKESLSSMQEEAGELEQKVAAVNKVEAGNNVLEYAEKSSSVVRKLSEVIGKTTEVSTVMKDAAASTGGKLSTALQTAGTALGGFSAKLSSVLSASAPYIMAVTAIVLALKKLYAVGVKFATSFSTALTKSVKAIYSFTTAVSRNFVAMLKAIGKFGASAVKTIVKIAGKVVDLGKKLNVFAKLSDALSDKFKRLGSTIKSALVFSVIYQGLAMLRQQVGEYLSVNTQFMTALRQLQGVLLTAFQPIYEIVVPALTTLINVLSRAAATVAQFFASIFGTTAKQAKVNAKNLYDQANATTAAGDAAENAANQLAGFDEINRISTEKESEGGSTSTSVATGPLFDYEFEETPFKSWGEAFSDFLDKLLAGIPKLKEAFKKFADWLNNLAKKLYDMFTFPGVLDKVKQLGRDLANALNELVNSINWYQLGQALGAGLNLALNFLTSFLYTFDWMNLGQKLAEFVNGLVSEIDWYEFGRLLWAGFKIGIETFAGFILGLDMPQLAEAASQVILGFFDEMKKTIELIPWDEIGMQIARFLNNIKWYDIITSVLAAISSAIMALKEMLDEFIATLNWSNIAAQIYTAINDALGSIDWRGLGQTLGNLFRHIFDFLRDIVANINWYEIGQNIADFILGFDFVRALGSLADLIAEGINAAIQLARGFLDKIMPEAESIAKGIADRLKKAIQNIHWDELGGVVGDGIKTALKLVAGLLDPELFYEIGKAIGEFLINLDWPGIIGGLAEALANGINSAVSLVNGFLESVKPRLKEIAENIAQKINEFVKNVDWAELGKTIHDGIDTALDFLLEILGNLDWDSIGQAVVDFLTNLQWGEILKKWGTVFGQAIGGVLKGIDLSELFSLGANMADGILTGMLNKWNESGGILGWIERNLFRTFIGAFKNLFGINSPSTVMAEQGGYLVDGLQKGISDQWHTISDFFSTVLPDLQTFLSESWSSIKEATSQKWEDIKTALVNKWESIRDNAKEKFDEVRGKVSSAWEKIKADVPGKWEAIKSTLSSAWSAIKETASSKFGEVKDKIIEKMDEVKNKDWKATGENIVDGILSGLETIWNNLKNWAKNVKDTIADALSGASSRGGTFGSSGGSGNGFSGGSGRSVTPYALPGISPMNIPALAAGAVIPPNRAFLAVLGDQNSGTNVEAPLATIEQAVENAITRMGGFGGDINITVESVLDGRVIARNMVKHINNMSRAAGKSVLQS